MTVTDVKLLTADDLLRLHSEGVRGELIQGVLHETMATGHRHGKIVMNLGASLFNYVKPRELGTLVASDSGVGPGGVVRAGQAATAEVSITFRTEGPARHSRRSRRGRARRPLRFG